MKAVILLISIEGLPIAETLRKEFPEVEVVTTSPVASCTQVASYETYLQEAFHRHPAFIIVGAMGICTRLIAPHIRDKYTDPAVLCIDSTARYVIPVLSGHIGKANELAERIARALGAEPVVTTRSDRTGLWSLDTLGERYGWSTSLYYPGNEASSHPHECMNKIIAFFVRKVPTLLCIEVRVPGVAELEASLPSHVTVCYALPDDVEGYQLLLRISPFSETKELPVPVLHFIPRILHVGLGLARQASPVDEVVAALLATLANENLHPKAIRCLATITEKRDEPVVRELQKKYPVHFFTAPQLKQMEVPTPSAVVDKYMGTPSVSEAAALLSSGNGQLIVTKRKGSNYTVAVAVEKGVWPSEGHIEIVGAGPGDAELISIRGRKMLEKADLILYAGSLVPYELTLCAKPGAVVRNSASMTLEEQFTLMKEHYDKGQLVVRLHTGDPCIYGAIEEQMNYFDRYGMDYHITPGISSFQAAAAELRSQFTIPERVQTIILTRGEGRTPMPEREQLHLLARSRSTMCIFLSASIADKVQAELMVEYPEDTPVAVCYHLTWRDQRIFYGKLKELATIVKENHLTLTTMIVVGEAIGNRQGQSRLYADEFKHLFRQ